LLAVALDALTPSTRARRVQRRWVDADEGGPGERAHGEDAVTFEALREASTPDLDLWELGHRNTAPRLGLVFLFAALAARPKDQPNRGAQDIESVAELVDQVPLVAEVH
jgi:hypothetical protein